MIDRCDPVEIDDIAEQLIHGEVGSKLKVMLAGGSRNFIPTTVQQHGVNGRRRDGKNLIDEWLAKSPSTRTYVSNRTLLMEIDTETYDGELFGMFHSSHMNFNLDTIRLNRQEINPTLTEMTQIAIKLLSKDEDGFFLLVEGSRIDHGKRKKFKNVLIILKKPLSLTKVIMEIRRDLQLMKHLNLIRQLMMHLRWLIWKKL